jgi:hypothetical protein
MMEVKVGSSENPGRVRRAIADAGAPLRRRQLDRLRAGFVQWLFQSMVTQ